MDKKIQRQILETIRDNGGQISVGYLDTQMKSKVLSKTKTGVDQSSHNLQLLLGQGLVEYANPEKVSIQLTHVGWQVFDPWYTKTWRFFTNDLAKILSVVATLLSIISITIALLT